MTFSFGFVLPCWVWLQGMFTTFPQCNYIPEFSQIPSQNLIAIFNWGCLRIPRSYIVGYNFTYPFPCNMMFNRFGCTRPLHVLMQKIKLHCRPSTNWDANVYRCVLITRVMILWKPNQVLKSKSNPNPGIDATLDNTTHPCIGLSLHSSTLSLLVLSSSLVCATFIGASLSLIACLSSSILRSISIISCITYIKPECFGQLADGGYLQDCRVTDFRRSQWVDNCTVISDLICFFDYHRVFIGLFDIIAHCLCREVASGSNCWWRNFEKPWSAELGYFLDSYNR